MLSAAAPGSQENWGNVLSAPSEFAVFAPSGDRQRLQRRIGVGLDGLAEPLGRLAVERALLTPRIGEKHARLKREPLSQDEIRWLLSNPSLFFNHTLMPCTTLVSPCTFSSTIGEHPDSCRIDSASVRE